MKFVDYSMCGRNNCINWKDGHCTLKDPEKNGDFCLDYEDSMDALRLKADSIRVHWIKNKIFFE